MFPKRRIKKSRIKSHLFNPHENGISSYDMAYLSSKKSFLKNPVFNNSKDSQNDYLVA